MIEGSDEYNAWRRARIGKATASRIGDVVAKARDGRYRATRNSYRGELVTERLTGVPYEGYQNADMRWGNETQPLAEAAYALYHTDIEPWPSGFANHPTILMSGASPDARIVGKNGLVEIKCPRTATHIETLLGTPPDSDYFLQCQWQMECTGTEFVDWCSFDPRMPVNMRLFVIRVPRDDDMIKQLRIEISDFLVEIDEIVAKLEANYGKALAA